MTDFNEIAQRYINLLPEMGPSSRWLNLRDLLRAAYDEGFKEGQLDQYKADQGE